VARVAVVTGGGRGIGRAAADRLARRGDDVAVLDADPDRLAGAPAALRLCVDVSDEAAVDAALAEVEGALGPIDVLVNNVGITTPLLVPLEELPLDTWRRVVDVNLTGTFLVTRRAGRAMIARGAGGVIVNVGSIYAGRAMDWRLYDDASPPRRQDEAAYHVTKAGIVQLTRVLATSWAPFRIRVCCVSPGPVDTEFVRETIAARESDLIAARVPAGRFARPEEIAACIEFVASPEASYLTGADVVVDGGWTCW
jgi:NAD(P)-dependent dehydrogenase (short-subunit alcohol dehydrogenase family)